MVKNTCSQWWYHDADGAFESWRSASRKLTAVSFSGESWVSESHRWSLLRCEHARDGVANSAHNDVCTLVKMILDLPIRRVLVVVLENVKALLSKQRGCVPRGVLNRIRSADSPSTRRRSCLFPQRNQETSLPHNWLLCLREASASATESVQVALLADVVQLSGRVKLDASGCLIEDGQLKPVVGSKGKGKGPRHVLVLTIGDSGFLMQLTLWSPVCEAAAPNLSRASLMKQLSALNCRRSWWWWSYNPPVVRQWGSSELLRWLWSQLWISWSSTLPMVCNLLTLCAFGFHEWKQNHPGLRFVVPAAAQV